MRQIPINDELLLIGVKPVKTVIGSDPHNIVTLHHISDIQTVKSTELRGDLLSYQTTVLLYHPEKTAVDTYPRPTIAFHIADTDVGSVAMVGIRADF